MPPYKKGNHPVLSYNSGGVALETALERGLAAEFILFLRGGGAAGLTSPSVFPASALKKAPTPEYKRERACVEKKVEKGLVV